MDPVNGELIVLIVAFAGLLGIPLASWLINDVGEQISAELDGGRTGTALGRHLDRRFGEGHGGAGAMREAEIRQMLEARSYVLTRQGKEPLDIEAELRRIMSGG